MTCSSPNSGSSLEVSSYTSSSTRSNTKIYKLVNENIKIPDAVVSEITSDHMLRTNTVLVLCIAPSSCSIRFLYVGQSLKIICKNMDFNCLKTLQKTGLPSWEGNCLTGHELTSSSNTPGCLLTPSHMAGTPCQHLGL